MRNDRAPAQRLETFAAWQAPPTPSTQPSSPSSLPVQARGEAGAQPPFGLAPGLSQRSTGWRRTPLCHSRHSRHADGDLFVGHAIQLSLDQSGVYSEAVIAG
jgi:hypothetical protein